MKRQLTDAERIASIREVIEAARGDWHEATALFSVGKDLDWLLGRSTSGNVDRLRERVNFVLSDEPTLEPTPKGAIWRWYSEGWNRCARDVRAALEGAEHQHRWVDARNEAVTSGEVCPDCGMLRAALEGAER